MRERRPLVYGVLAALIVAILVGVLWWRDYRSSPRYALGQVASAAAAGDWATFQRYVAVSEVSSDIANQIIAQRLGDKADSGVLGALADAAQPVLAQEVEHELKSAIESRQGTSNTGERLGAFFYTNDPKEISERGDRAFVTIDVPYQGKTRELKLQMRNRNGRWRVVQVMNIDELIRQQ